MPRPRKSETICFRVDPAVRLQLESIAFDDSEHESDTLSEYVRVIMDDWIDAYAKQAGGMEPLIDRWLARKARLAADEQAHTLEVAEFAKHAGPSRHRR
jgi:hypothetical protein